MKDLFSILKNYEGRYEGSGLNHENEEFQGIFELAELFAEKGYQIKFLAHAPHDKSMVFHSEHSIIAPSIAGTLTLFNLNSNTPFMSEHQLASFEQTSSGFIVLFRLGNLADVNSFREEIKLELLDRQKVAYHYSWGLPGGEFSYRSGLVMNRII